MFCIYQSDSKLNETIVDLIGSRNEYLPKIMKLIEDKFAVRILDGVHFHDIKDTQCFSEGYYLLNNGICVQLVLKYEVTNSGFIYSTTYMHAKILFTWKLLPLENKNIEFATNTNSNPDDIHSDISNPDDIYSDDDIDDAKSYSFFAESESNSEGEESLDDTIKIKNFDINYMCDNPSILVIGKRETGKSTIISNILNNMITAYDPIKELLIFSPKERKTRFYQGLYPHAKIFCDYNVNEIKKYLSKRSDKNYLLNNKGCIVFDDSLTPDQYKFADEVTELIYNARHYNTTLIMTQQLPLLRPDLRANIDYVFLGNYEDSVCHRRTLFNYHGGIFPTFELFNKYLSQSTKDYGFMVIHNRVKSLNIEDKIFEFNALLHKKID